MATIKTRMSFSSVGDVTATNSVVSWFPRIRSEFRRAKGDLVRFFVSASTNSFNSILALSAVELLGERSPEWGQVLPVKFHSGAA